MNAKQMFGSENAYRMKTVKTMTCDCGKILHQGSGQFATDYRCDKCGQEYNSAGTGIMKYISEAEEYAHEGDSDPY